MELSNEAEKYVAGKGNDLIKGVEEMEKAHEAFKVEVSELKRISEAFEITLKNEQELTQNLKEVLSNLKRIAAETGSESDKFRAMKSMVDGIAF